MIYRMQLRHYMMRLRNCSNQPVSLNLLLAPFGLVGTCEVSSKHLVVGHVVDDLMDQYREDAVIDALDVVSSAWELGYEPAGVFLEEGPLMMYRLLQEEGHLDEVSPLF